MGEREKGCAIILIESLSCAPLVVAAKLAYIWRPLAKYMRPSSRTIRLPTNGSRPVVVVGITGRPGDGGGWGRATWVRLF